jgi:hypothetical protein
LSKEIQIEEDAADTKVIGSMEPVMTVSGQKFQEIPINYWDSIHGTFEFRCTCGHIERGPWDEARWLSIQHVEERHASETSRKDFDFLYDEIEKLISPNPFCTWDESQELNSSESAT